VCYCIAAAVPHFNALMALSDHSFQQYDSEMASTDGSYTDHLPGNRTDHPVINYGPAKARYVQTAY